MNLIPLGLLYFMTNNKMCFYYQTGFFLSKFDLLSSITWHHCFQFVFDSAVYSSYL